MAEAVTSVTSVASKAVAAAQGPLHALRGTGEAEKMLKNARTQYHNEFEEIGFYAGIEALAETVGDKETAKLARGIKREEERMAKFLEKQIPQLAKAVAREEIPAAERNGGSAHGAAPAHGARRAGRAARRTAVEQLAEVDLARSRVAAKSVVARKSSGRRRRGSGVASESSRSRASARVEVPLQVIAGAHPPEQQPAGGL